MWTKNSCNFARPLIFENVEIYAYSEAGILTMDRNKREYRSTCVSVDVKFIPSLIREGALLIDT